MGNRTRTAVVVATTAAAATSTTLSLLLASAGQERVDAFAVALAVTAYLVVGAVLCLARPQEPVSWLLLGSAAAWGIGEGMLALGVQGLDAPGESSQAAVLAVLGTAVRAVGWLSLVVLLPLVFPDGRSPWPARRWPLRLSVVAIVGFTVACLFSPTPLERRIEAVDSPIGLPESLRAVTDVLALGSLALALVALATALAGLVHRWRSGGALVRQQVLWFGAAFTLPAFFLPLIATEMARPWMFAFVVLPVPVATAVALLQRRLYDIHLVVGRGLAFIGLSVAVAVLYAVTVGGIGALLGARGAPWLGWVGAGVVAVSFVPLRDSLQRAANRVVYGRWSDPAEVLRLTARRVADTTDPTGLLDTLTTEVAQGLGLSAVWILDGSRVVARHGAPGEQTGGIDLTAYGSPVGRLEWRGGSLRDTDLRLLEDLAGQVGAVLHAVGLVDSLQAARARLVLAREEERRRLRRDLHDGLGPELAALTMGVDTLRNRAGDPALDLDAELLALRAGIQSAVRSVRRVVEGLRPPALDEVGLAGALEQLAVSLSGGPRISVDAGSLPPLAAATEVAAYRVVQEALHNASRHAGAAQASVRVRVVSDRLVVTVDDDGVGGAGPRTGGVGMGSMAERAAELGGTCAVSGRSGGGTSVRLELPVTQAASRRVEVVDA